MKREAQKKSEIKTLEEGKALSFWFGNRKTWFSNRKHIKTSRITNGLPFCVFPIKKNRIETIFSKCSFMTQIAYVVQKSKRTNEWTNGSEKLSARIANNRAWKHSIVKHFTDGILEYQKLYVNTLVLLLHLF